MYMYLFGMPNLECFLQESLQKLQEKSLRPVTQRQADSLAKQIQAAGDRAYLVSALTKQGLDELLTAVVQEALISNGVLQRKKGKAPESIVKMSTH